MERMDMKQIGVGLLGSPSKKDTKAPDSTHCIVSHYNIGIIEINSLLSFKDCWLLDTSATSHMNFRRDCFKELNGIENVILYFADKSILRPRGIVNQD